jgi:hypothetical protein
MIWQTRYKADALGLSCLRHSCLTIELTRALPSRIGRGAFIQHPLFGQNAEIAHNQPSSE